MNDSCADENSCGVEAHPHYSDEERLRAAEKISILWEGDETMFLDRQDPRNMKECPLDIEVRACLAVSMGGLN